MSLITFLELMVSQWKMRRQLGISALWYVVSTSLSSVKAWIHPITTCSDLYATDTDFEMVVVAKMNRLADHREVFDHFLSGFRSPCFVIPFGDSERRDFICKHLDLNLGRLLGCRLSDVLHKINAECGDDVVTTSDLNEKVVGLFLRVEGKFIPMLQKAYEQCLTQQKAFEIVLVYIPFEDSLNPTDYQSYVDNLLQKHKLSLWRLPFDNSVSRKLWRLTHNPCDDQLIIIGANNAFIDPYGGEVMSSCGIDAYPFTGE